ncbi:MAG: hypothetical protein CMJ17_14395 [Phenylobacterium sp.]|nr:hypothetical protein [Phenylobacterium sp.]
MPVPDTIEAKALRFFVINLDRSTERWHEIAQSAADIGVDVTRGRSITARDVARPSSVFRWILSGAWRQGPPIVSLLMRAATVPTGRDLRAARESVDLLVTPDMTGVEIRNWEAYDPAVTAGYHAMGEALDRLTTPVTEMRRRKALSEGGGKGWR